jgi:hypothetical protein
VWLSEVEPEYFALLEKGRDVGVDVGNQFRAFEHILDEGGVEASWRPIERAGNGWLYAIYGRYTTMFFAVSRRRAARCEMD